MGRVIWATGLLGLLGSGCGEAEDTAISTGSLTGTTGVATGTGGTATGSTATTGTTTGTTSTSAYPIDIQVLSFDANCEGDPGKVEPLILTEESEAIEVVYRTRVADICTEWEITAQITGAQLIEVTHTETGTPCLTDCWWYMDYRLHDVPAGTYNIVVDGVEDAVIVPP